jgi:small conductance mechanosensitive channel
MMTETVFVASAAAGLWQPWHGDFKPWFMTSGLHILMLVIGGVLAGRFINWSAHKVAEHLDARVVSGEAMVRPEATKHRAAMASVIAWVAVAIIFVVVALSIVNVLNLPVNPLAGPAAVLGAALGFGARGVIEDLLAGFFVVAERQYGFGDLVRLDLTSMAVAEGTVEDVTLRVTKLRSSEGEVFTVGNGKVVKSTNLSKDWARAVVDIPVSTTADLGLVNQVLHQECEHAHDDAVLGKLLLDVPSVMGVESIEVDTVNLRMVARTLPGKQFEAGRELRVLVVRALTRAGIVTATDATPKVATYAPSAQVGDIEAESQDLVRER